MQISEFPDFELTCSFIHYNKLKSLVFFFFKLVIVAIQQTVLISSFMVIINLLIHLHTASIQRGCWWYFHCQFYWYWWWWKCRRELRGTGHWIWRWGRKIICVCFHKHIFKFTIILHTKCFSIVDNQWFVRKKVFVNWVVW